MGEGKKEMLRQRGSHLYAFAVTGARLSSGLAWGDCIWRKVTVYAIGVVR